MTDPLSTELHTAREFRVPESRRIGWMALVRRNNRRAMACPASAIMSPTISVAGLIPLVRPEASSAVRRISQNLLMYSGQGRGLKPWRVLTQESGVADELGGSGCGGVFESRPSPSRTTAPDTLFESGSDPVSGRIQRGALCTPLLSEPTTGLTRAAGLVPLSIHIESTPVSPKSWVVSSPWDERRAPANPHALI